jgi:hypothetical protein
MKTEGEEHAEEKREEELYTKENWNEDEEQMSRRERGRSTNSSMRKTKD